jgi:hypothetical protein
MKTMRRISWAGLFLVVGMVMAAPAEEPTVIGLEVNRPSGGYLGVALEGVSLVVRFYDEDKELIPAEADRAAMWWDAPNRSGRQRAVLNRTGDGLGLRSLPQVRPPYTYFVSITLLRADGSTLEHHQVDLRAVVAAANP